MQDGFSFQSDSMQNRNKYNFTRAELVSPIDYFLLLINFKSFYYDITGLKSKKSAEIFHYTRQAQHILQPDQHDASWPVLSESDHKQQEQERNLQSGRASPGALLKS